MITSDSGAVKSTVSSYHLYGLVGKEGDGYLSDWM